jgi:AraC-like DNA-binding protein
MELSELDCRRAIIPAQRMPHFVRRPAVAMHLLVRGGIRVLVSTGRRYEYAPGRVTLTWGAIPHLAEFTAPRNEMWVATFPLGLLLRWGLPEPFVAAALRGDPLAEPDAARGEGDAAMMARWSDDLRRGEPESRRIMTMELEARVHRLARDVRLTRRTRSRVPVLTDKVERMLQLIATSAPGRRVPRVADLAAAVGVHPDTASRLFARSVGTGLLAFLTQHRVALAQSLLASTDAKVADVAEAAGFGSVSQFHAVFRRHTGQTPDRYRRAVHALPNT